VPARGFSVHLIRRGFYLQIGEFNLSRVFLIDHFGWLGVTVHSMNPARLAGVALLLAGGHLVGKF
jgi:hypothetical protein